MDGAKPKRSRFKAYPIGFFHLDVEPRGSPGIAEVRTEQGKLHLFVAVDRTSTFAFAQLHEGHAPRRSRLASRALAHTLPDGTDPETEAATDAIWAARGEPRMCRIPAFNGACAQLGVEHRLTKPKEATVRRA